MIHGWVDGAKTELGVDCCFASSNGIFVLVLEWQRSVVAMGFGSVCR
jgi:hypothetical protein